MRQLITDRIIEICVWLDATNGVLKVLNRPILKEFDEEYFHLALNTASNEDLLSAYDLLSTPDEEWEIMFGFKPEDCII